MRSEHVSAAASELVFKGAWQLLLLRSTLGHDCNPEVFFFFFLRMAAPLPIINTHPQTYTNKDHNMRAFLIIHMYGKS